MDIREELFKNQDVKYADFHSKLIPTVEREKIIGVRVPVLRKIAKQGAKENCFTLDYYYEEIMVKGMMIGYEKNSIEQRLAKLRNFIPLIDNWAVCDCCCATYKFTLKNKKTVWNFITEYLEKGEYEIRFAVVMMLDYYLDDDYIDAVLEILSALRSDKYYVNMAVAWTLSAAYIKYKDRVEQILDKKLLSPWVHNKTIQKICESYRVESNVKKRLKSKKISTE